MNELPKLKRKRAYLQSFNDHNRIVPKLRTVYQFSHHGLDFFVAHDLNNEKYWNVYDCATGITIYNKLARKTREEAVETFVNAENIFIYYLKFIDSDRYKEFKYDFQRIKGGDKS